ncbi:MAG: hypothetical protein GXP28_06400 [Planctomycetes bacterium]|nr:hypothetical protein [Planctomycetota bacterium]
MQLRWKASFSATCLYAAHCMAEGLPIADARLAAALQPAVDQLLREIKAWGWSSESMLPLLVSLAAEHENNRQLVQRAADKLRGAGALGREPVVRLAGCVADLEAAMLGERPQLVEELAVRGRPLREQWEARGPGLLREMSRLVAENSFLAPAAEIVLVAPLVGGHGQTHLPSNRVTFEAVLANPHAELSEVLRLGWLLGQLNFDLPCFSDSIPGSRLELVARLAALPLVLAAAERVELVSPAPDIGQTLECWHLPAETSECLHDWWQTYTASDVRWTVALAGLNAMLAK